jgi:AraC-like DNA-binding protein
VSNIGKILSTVTIEEWRMRSLQPIDLQSKLDSFSFLEVVTSTSQRGWSLQSAEYRLMIPSEGMPPPVIWSQHTLVLHLSGSANTLMFNQGDGWHRHISQPGTLYYQARNAATDIIWSESAINLSVTFDHALFSLIAAETRRGDSDSIELQVSGCFDDAFLAHLAWTVRSLLHQTDANPTLYIDSLHVTLIHHLLHFYSSTKPLYVVPHIITHPQLRRALDYMHTEYMNNPSLTEIAAICNLSVAHFSRLFRLKVGVSPYQYLLRYRAEQAYRLLKSKRYTIAEVAQLIGFYDESHLRRCFKRMYGVSMSTFIDN